MKFLRPLKWFLTWRRNWLFPTLVGLAVTIIALWAHRSEPPFLDRFNNVVLDSFQRQHPREYIPGTPVRIVDIDDESITKVGQWPWPRTVVAKLNDRLGEAGAAVVAYDIVFSEPDRTSPENIIKVLQDNPASYDDFANVSTLLPHDEIFAKSVGETRVVTGLFLVGAEAEGPLPRSHSGFAYSGEENWLPDKIERYGGAIFPLPELYESASGAGHVSFKPDGDGIIRSAPLLGRIGDRLVPSLSAEALRVAQDASSFMIRSSNASNEWGSGQDKTPDMTLLRIGQFDVPTTADGKILVHYTRPQADRYVPAWKVLSDAPEDQDWYDKVAGQIIFVGTSSVGLKDIVSTPIRSGEAGVLVHAQAAEQIISGDFLYKPYWVNVLEFGLIGVLGILMTLILPRLGALRGAILILVIGNIIYWTAYYAFVKHGLLIDPAYPLLAISVSYILITLTSYYMTESERSQIRGAFSMYLSPTMVKQVSENPKLLTLGGVEREISILFLDIRSFSSISESMRPQDITIFLNKFLTPMTNILQSHGATIDKYIGDAIVAFWSAPIEDPIHEQNAANAVLKMQESLAGLNEKYTKDPTVNWPDNVSIGMGINTGVCCVGNLGSEQRFSYSMIGDAANLASRIEGLTKQYGVSNLLGSKTVSALEGFALIEADNVEVVGRKTAERIFMLAGDTSAAEDKDFIDYKAAHEKFLSAYRAQKWAAAKAMLPSLVTKSTLYNLQGYYKKMEDRISGFETNPPPKDWDGIFRSQSK